MKQQRPSVFPVAAAVCLLMVGCSAEKKPAPEVWLKDKPAVLHGIDDLRNRQNQLDDALALARKQSKDQLSANQQQDAAIAALQENVSQLQAEVRRLQHTAARLNESRKIARRSLDKKIEKIAQAMKPAPEPVDQTGSAEDEKDHYTAAYLALKSGRYDEAIDKFRELLKLYPKGSYSDQAYYWLGESYLAQNNLGRAIGNLEWMVAHYPGSTKHAAAMLRLGMAYQAQQRTDDARAILNQLIKIHADSPAAEEARKLLQSTSDASGK